MEIDEEKFSISLHFRFSISQDKTPTTPIFSVIENHMLLSKFLH